MAVSGGHEVVTAHNGAEALEVLAATPEVRAIITDLRMPRLNGLRLIRNRRETDARRRSQGIRSLPGAPAPPRHGSVARP